MAAAMASSARFPLMNFIPSSRSAPRKYLEKQTRNFNLNLTVCNKLRIRNSINSVNGVTSQSVAREETERESAFNLKLLLERYVSVLRESVEHTLVWCTSMAAILSILTLNVVDTGDANAFVVTPARKLQADELATVRLFQENTPSVVYITNLAVRQDAFTLDVLEVPQGSGSGFIWDQQGHIVTNYHVIRGASDVRVTLGDQSTYEAKVVGYDQDKDVAVLSVNAPKGRRSLMGVSILNQGCMQLRKLLEEHEVRLLQKLVQKTFGNLYGSTNAGGMALKSTKVNCGKGEKRDFDTMNKTVDLNTHKISGGKNSANFSEVSSKKSTHGGRS